MMMAMGEFEQAIAVAPKVSLKFWQACIEQYRAHLQAQVQTKPSSISIQGKDPVNDYVDYSILSGAIDDAASQLKESG